MKDGTKISDLSEFEQAQIEKSMSEAYDLAQEAWDEFCYETLSHYPDMETPELQFLYPVSVLGGVDPTERIYIRDWNSFTKSITDSLLDDNHSGYEIIGFDSRMPDQPETVLEALGISA